MRAFRFVLRHLVGPQGGRFDRYYGGVLAPGAGYPTADEAKRDLRARNHTAAPSVAWQVR